MKTTKHLDQAPPSSYSSPIVAFRRVDTAKEENPSCRLLRGCSPSPASSAVSAAPGETGERPDVDVLGEQLRVVLLVRKGIENASLAADTVSAKSISMPPEEEEHDECGEQRGGDASGSGSGAGADRGPLLTFPRASNEEGVGVPENNKMAIATPSTAAATVPPRRGGSFALCEAFGEEDGEEGPRKTHAHRATHSSLTVSDDDGMIEGFGDRAAAIQRRRSSCGGGPGTMRRRMRRRNSLTDMVSLAARKLGESMSNLGGGFADKAQQGPAAAEVASFPPKTTKPQQRPGVDPNDPRHAEIAKLRAELAVITSANKRRDTHITQMRMHRSILHDLAEEERAAKLSIAMETDREERRQLRIRRLDLAGAPDEISVLRRGVEKSARRVKQMKKAVKKIETGKAVDESKIAELLRRDSLEGDAEKRLDRSREVAATTTRRKKSDENWRPSGRKMRRSAWKMKSATMFGDDALSAARTEGKETSLVGMMLTVTLDAAEENEASLLQDNQDHNNDEKRKTECSNENERPPRRRRRPAKKTPTKTKKKNNMTLVQLLAEKEELETTVERMAAAATSTSASPTPSSFWSRRLEDIMRWDRQHRQQQDHCRRTSVDNDGSLSSLATSLVDQPRLAEDAAPSSRRDARRAEAANFLGAPDDLSSPSFAP